MSKEDGGPAFPHEVPEDPNGHWSRHSVPGMSLRDYFAAAALTGLLSAQADQSGITPLDISTDAFRIADAMLAARSK